jgi:hypothetical protein
VLIEDKPSEQNLVHTTGATAVFLNPDELALLTGFHRKVRVNTNPPRFGAPSSPNSKCVRVFLHNLGQLRTVSVTVQVARK